MGIKIFKPGARLVSFVREKSVCVCVCVCVCACVHACVCVSVPQAMKTIHVK